MKSSNYPPNVNLEEIGVEEKWQEEEIMEDTTSLEEKLEALNNL